MKKKARLWLIIWLIASLIAGLYNKITETFYFLDHGVALQYPPYTDVQIFLFLFFVPLCLIPALCTSYHYAVKEKNKKIKIITCILIGHHIFCWIGILVTHITGTGQ